MTLDDDLARAVRRTGLLRQGFYLVVLAVALAGQVTGATERLHIPLMAAVPAVAALELGGIVVLANADVRRRLGEHAVASRVLSAGIAAWAVAFNWLAHGNHLLGGFFAGMSALGYLVWLMHTENQRRDRLRAAGQLPPTAPAYETVGHWLRHPWLTRRARSLAKADTTLGLYGSLAAARAEVRSERRQAAIAKVLHRKIRAAVDPRHADIAIAVYDLDEIARRLADGADYDGLTHLIAVDLAPARVLAEPVPVPVRPSAAVGDDLDALWLSTLTVPSDESDTPAVPIPVSPAPAPISPWSTPLRDGTDEGQPECTDRSRRRTREPLPDEFVRALLEHPTFVPRNADGTVPPRRAARLLGIGVERARKALAEQVQADSEPVPVAVPINGTDPT